MTKLRTKELIEKMHHNLDSKPVPEIALYINEPDLADATINYFGCGKQEEESQADHISTLVPDTIKFL